MNYELIANDLQNHVLYFDDDNIIDGILVTRTPALDVNLLLVVNPFNRETIRVAKNILNDAGVQDYTYKGLKVDIGCLAH